MEFTHDLADDAGGFDARGVGPNIQAAHAVEDAALYRLEAVAHIRQRARHQRGDRVAEVRAAQLLLDIDDKQAALAIRTDHWRVCAGLCIGVCFRVFGGRFVSQGASPLHKLCILYYTL